MDCIYIIIGSLLIFSILAFIVFVSTEEEHGIKYDDDAHESGYQDDTKDL